MFCSVLFLPAAMCSSSQLVFPLIYSSFISGRHTCPREGAVGQLMLSAGGDFTTGFRGPVWPEEGQTERVWHGDMQCELRTMWALLSFKHLPFLVLSWHKSDRGGSPVKHLQMCFWWSSGFVCSWSFPHLFSLAGQHCLRFTLWVMISTYQHSTILDFWQRLQHR